MNELEKKKSFLLGLSSCFDVMSKMIRTTGLSYEDDIAQLVIHESSLEIVSERTYKKFVTRTGKRVAKRSDKSVTKGDTERWTVSSTRKVKN